MNLRSYFLRLVASAERMYERQIQLLLREKGELGIALDCGCSQGESTMHILGELGARLLLGFDIEEYRLVEARQRGIAAVQVDLNRGLCLRDESIDLIYSNQVIEHLWDTDRFLSELHRVLKKRGVLVLCTENLASWHNIFSLFLGFQPFSLTNISAKVCGVGNPLALHRGERPTEGTPWRHVRVCSYQGIKELLRFHGFAVEAVRGSGYYPLPAFLGDIDKRHAAFLVVRARRE
jgi:SAM-dependent methyltransferase